MKMNSRLNQVVKYVIIIVLIIALLLRCNIIGIEKYVRNLPIGICFSRQKHTFEYIGSIHTRVVTSIDPMKPLWSKPVNEFSDLNIRLMLFPDTFVQKRRDDDEKNKIDMVNASNTDSTLCHYDLEKGIAYQADIDTGCLITELMFEYLIPMMFISLLTNIDIEYVIYTIVQIFYSN